MNKTEQTADKRVRVLQKHQYTIKQELGRGISGIVFLVDSIERNPYVIKEMNCRDDKDRKQIEAEVKNLRTLNHGYIVAYVDSFEDEETGLFYVVMEYCGGGDLHKRMEEQAKRNDVFEEEQILDWLVQMCLALQYLHANNVYHRDIKSQNVFLTKDGYLNLGDFGYSKTLESADVYAKSVVGADLYVSPEAMKKHYDSKSDIWSLGWLLHDLCMLDVWSDIIERRYLHAVSMKGMVPPISERYSEELRGLIRQMLSCNLHERPSADEILAKPFLRDAVITNRRIPEALEERFMKSIGDFDTAYKDCVDFLSELNSIADSLEETHRKCTAGSLSGAVIGAAGGITALVGAILAPFTLGASLIVTGVGVGIGVAGGVTGAASNITNMVKQKSLRQSLERMGEDYKADELIFSSPNTLSLLRKIKKFHSFVSESRLDDIQMSWRIGRTTVVCATEMVTLCMLANVGRIGAQAAKVGRAAAAASGVLSGIFVLADVAFIVKDSQEIHEIRRGQNADPEKIKSSVLRSIGQMRKTHSELSNILKNIKETREQILKKRQQREKRSVMRETKYKYSSVIV